MYGMSPQGYRMPMTVRGNFQMRQRAFEDDLEVSMIKDSVNVDACQIDEESFSLDFFSNKPTLLGDAPTQPNTAKRPLFSNIT